MTLTLLNTAELAEAKLHHLLGHPTNPDDQFQLKSSRLYGVTITDDDEAKLTLISKHADVYELLERASRKVAKSFDFTAVVTTGWAAPLPKDYSDDDEVTAPSQHPDKRRVRLVIVASPVDVVSVLRFQDEPDATITDEGGATGSLNDAIRQFMR